VAPESFTGTDQYFRPALYIPLMMAPRLSATITTCSSAATIANCR
jgi:hypothetical protein